MESEARQTGPSHSTASQSGALPPHPGPLPSHPVRWWILRAGLGLGLLGNLLLREDPWGLNAALWCAALAWSALAFVRRTGILGQRLESWPLLLIVLGGLGMAGRDSGFLFMAHLGTAFLGALLLLSQAGTGSALRSGTWTLATTGLSLAKSFVSGIAPLVPTLLRDLRVSNLEDRRFRTLVLGLLLAGPLIAVFGGLLVAADPLFQHYVSRIFGPNWGEVASHAVLTGFFTWIVGGALLRLYLTAEAEERPTRVIQAPDGAAAILALGLLATLLVTFLGVQLRAVLGGDDFVRATLGLTYAGYARTGFFQLVAVVVLILPTLMAAHWAVADSAPELGSRFRRLSLLVLASAGVLLFSAFARMRLYQSHFGLTELRFYTQAFMLWLGFVLVWFALTYLRGRTQGFLAGPLMSGFALLLALNVLNPEAVIVRTNLQRSMSPSSAVPSARQPATASSFDVSYVTYLSADAVPALVEALPRLNLRDRCALAERLVERWVHTGPDDWRSWKLSRWRARALVLALAEGGGVQALGCT